MFIKGHLFQNANYNFVLFNSENKTGVLQITSQTSKRKKSD